MLIDDEDLSRQEMRHLLESYPDIQIVGEAANTLEALDKIRKLQPDLIFLDINMPGKNGFELLADLDTSPQVVFVTAYDEYAVKAFETNALDYLLKPVRAERLKKSVDSIRTAMLEHPKSNVAQGQDSNEKLRPDSQVFLKDGDNFYFVRLSEIFLFESEDNYVRVHFSNNRPLHRKSLNSLEEKLPRELFFRANRQQIFNLSFITNIEPFFHGSLRVTLQGGIRVEISVRRASEFKEKLSL